MKKRNLAKRIVSFGMAITMTMGCLSNVSATVFAQATTENVVLEEVTTEETIESTKTVGIDGNSKTNENVETYITTESVEAENIGVNASNNEMYGSCLFGNFENTGEVPEEAIIVESVDNYYQLVGNDSSRASGYKNAVDNSTNENAIYLPPVLCQYGGSCGSYAYAYALGTYTINRARVKSSQDIKNQLSPLFVYNLTRYNYSDGTPGSVVASFLLHTGAATAEYAPISNTYNNYDTTWYPTKEAWKSAAANRIEKVIKLKDIPHLGTPITGPNDSDLDLIKTTLANGNIIGFSSNFLTYNYTTIPYESPSHAGEWIVDRCDVWVDDNGDGQRDLGGHGMVIVGYDDTIWTDINGDGKKQSAEYGALKIMNSHGTWWKNDGFVWVAYDALNKVSAASLDECGCGEYNIDRWEFFAYENAMYTYAASQEESTASDLLLVATINTNNRVSMGMKIIAKSKETGHEYVQYVDAFSYCGGWKGKYAFDGSPTPTDGTIVVDIGAGIGKELFDERFTLSLSSIDEYKWTVQIFESYEGYSGFTDTTVKEMYIEVDGIRRYDTEIINTFDTDGKSSTKQQTISCTLEKIPVFEIIEIKSSKAPEDTTETEPITFTAITNVVDDSECDIEYCFMYRPVGSASGYTVIRDFSPDPTCTWITKDSKYGMEILVLAHIYRYGNCESASELFVFNVNSAPWIVNDSLSVFDSEIGYVPRKMELGESLPIWMDVCYGTGTIKYMVEVSYNGGEKKLFYEGEKPKDLYWTPDKPGRYEFWLTAVDENGFKDTISRDVDVEFGIVDFTSNKASKDTTESECIIFNVSTKGGTYEEYQFVFRTSMGDKIIRDYLPQPMCAWIAEHSYYAPEIVVNVRNTVTGDIVSKSMSFQVNKKPTITGCSITSGDMKLGESQQILISGMGGTGTLNREVVVWDMSGIRTVYYDGPATNDLYWTPDKPGTYRLLLSLVDENGFRDTREATVNVVFRITDFTSSKLPNITTATEPVIFTVETEGGSDVEYQFVFHTSMGDKVIRDYSPDPSCTWIAEHSYYNPAIIVNVRDKKTGESTNGSMNFGVNLAPAITGVSITSGNMNFGESKQILINGNGGTGKLRRVVEVSHNGGAKSVYYNGEATTNLYWTPDKAGTYKLWLSLEDNNGIRDTREVTMNVVKTTNSAIVYYYNSSYSNAYIHYKVNNGSWTSVPGVKMESSSEQTGYMWKYEIDLGDETGATVCFNNGSGSWDSRNGANYTVGVGLYGIKNNTVTELKPVSAITFTVDKKSPVSVTDSVVLSADVKSATGTYEYRFGTIFNDEEIILSYGYTTSNSYNMSLSNVIGNVNAKAVGTHVLFVDVKNTATGEVERATIDNYKVEGLKITSFTAGVTSPQKTGTSIALKVKVANEATYRYNTYRFTATKNGVTTVISPSAEYSATWTPTEAGTYTLTYYIVDNYGQEATKSITYTIVDESATTTTVYYSNSSWSQAYIHYQIGNGSWTSVPGVKMSTNTSGNGYTWKYELDLGTATKATVCFNNGNGSWDSKNGSNYTLGLGVFGIKNNTITELEEKLSVSVSADKSVGGTYNTTKFTVKATNGTAPYTYKLAIVSKGQTPTDNSYFTISSTGVYNYTPQTAGNYTVYAKVIDADGNTAVTNMNYTIEGPQFKSFTATATDKKVGTAATLKAEFTNFQYDAYNTYAFVIEKDGISTSYSAGSTGTYVWTPTEEGTYTITAQFKTFSGAIYEKSMTYEVSNGNTVTIYYNSSWSNANIHYCIAGGSWTAVPGVAMTKTSEKAGYTHKIVIDLGTASSITICFNNGNGSWDSRNGANYKAYTGTYGVSNGTVSKLN